MASVTIIGSGYTGGELLRYLMGHEKVNEITLVTNTFAGKSLAEVAPKLAKVSGKKFTATGKNVFNDVVFTATPHGKAMAIAQDVLDAGSLLVDLSADFRLTAPEFKKWYGLKHACPALLETAVYGLPELFRDKIKKAKIIANPGCYPTSTLLLLYPLVKDKIIQSNTIMVNSCSGTSGAGLKMERAYLHAEMHGNMCHYALACHRHTPEMRRMLKLATGKEFKLSFTPALMPLSRGMLTCAKAQAKEADPLKAYKRHYSKEPFIRIVQNPEVKNVNYTNFCDLTGIYDNDCGLAVMVSAIDNLGKGAAGQAVQNMNLIKGFKETEGLLAV